MKHSLAALALVAIVPSLRAQAKTTQRQEEGAKESKSTGWTLQRAHSLWLAATYMHQDKVLPLYLDAMKKFPHPSCESAKELLAASEASMGAAEAAKDHLLIQELRAGQLRAEAGLAIYNRIAQQFDLPARTVTSPHPNEPERLRQQREDREKKIAERAEEEALKWSRAKVRALGRLIDALDQEKKVAKDSWETISRLRLAADADGYHRGNYRSGPDYDRMAASAEKLLEAYNRLVPQPEQRTVRTVLQPPAKITSDSKIPPAEEKSGEPANPATEEEASASKKPAATWSPSKIAELTHIVRGLPKLKRPVTQRILQRLNRLHAQLQASVLKAGDATSGAAFDRMARDADKLLAAYKLLVSSADRVNPEELGGQ